MESKFGYQPLIKKWREFSQSSSIRSLDSPIVSNGDSPYSALCLEAGPHRLQFIAWTSYINFRLNICFNSWNLPLIQDLLANSWRPSGHNNFILKLRSMGFLPDLVGHIPLTLGKRSTQTEWHQTPRNPCWGEQILFNSPSSYPSLSRSATQLPSISGRTPVTQNVFSCQVQRILIQGPWGQILQPYWKQHNLPLLHELDRDLYSYYIPLSILFQCQACATGAPYCWLFPL